MKYYSVFFPLAMMVQGVHSFSQDSCETLGELANANAERIKDALDENFGGPFTIEEAPVNNYNTFVIEYKEPSFDGCEVTIGADITAKSGNPIMFPDQTGTATIKATFDFRAIRQGELCIRDIELVELDLGDLPGAEDIENAIKDSIDIPDQCVGVSTGRA